MSATEVPLFLSGLWTARLQKKIIIFKIKFLFIDNLLKKKKI